jgi:trimeric autotransporter adhesin
MNKTVVKKSIFSTLIIFCLASLAAAQEAEGAEAGERAKAFSPISNILNHDGSMRPGVSGNFDAKGFRMWTDPNGSPRFVPEGLDDTSVRTPQECDNRWDSRFGQLGSSINGAVYAVAVSGDSVYVGGSFTRVGEVATTNIARWNGSGWTGLGTGINGIVLAITVSGTDVYAGGLLYSAGGVSVNGIAKWDGAIWSSLGGGLTGEIPAHVRAIEVVNGNVYAGGQFTAAGSLAVAGIAKWDGTAWSPLGIGLTRTTVLPEVRALAVSGNDLFVGGQFDTAGGVTADGIAKWNGTSWSALGSGRDIYNIQTLVVSGGDLYAGGLWGVNKWNGTNWSRLDGLFGRVYKLATSGNGDLYANGLEFEIRTSSTTTVCCYRFAKWNGTNWTGIAGINSSYDSGLAGYGSTGIIVGGSCPTAGTRGLSLWNGSNWMPSALGLASDYSSLNADVRALAASGPNTYVGGEFTTADGSPANHIAKWDGTNWSGLGPGVNGAVYAVAISDSNVYVGGYFTLAGGIAANNIARWDGASWSNLDSGVNGAVYSIAVSGKHVYAGGAFTNAGKATANNIARWDGANWSGLGGGMNGAVLTVGVSGPEIYAGGYFTTAGGATARGIAKWSSAGWSPLGSGLSDQNANFYPYPFVSGIAISGTDVYVAGTFTHAGGTLVNHVAKWNGSSWSALGSGIHIPFYCDKYYCGYLGGSWTITVSGSDVYVGGSFATDNGYHIAKWDGTGWHGVGGGVNANGENGFVNALAVSGSDIAVGGDFVNAGCRFSPYFAVYHSRASRQAPFDFDGDSRSDIGVFRPSDSVWYLDRSTQGFTAFNSVSQQTR